MSTDLHEAMTYLSAGRRQALCRAAAESRDAAVAEGDPGMARVWQAVSVAAAEVEDVRASEVRWLEDLMGPDGFRDPGA